VCLLLLATAVGLGCFARPKEAPASADLATLRTITQGQLVGFATEAGAHAWRGIPFARPPVGTLRWRAPLGPEPFSETFEALAHGPSCIQVAGPGGGRDGAKSGKATGSEDCLVLNVYAPPMDPKDVPTGDARLPVMLWIHGGGNTVGDATTYDASLLARQEQVIVVAVQYRLGVMGWFSHPALRAGETSAIDGSGNYGTLDVVRSLAWVAENISGFGGDPGRVTVFGESAGASDTFAMLLSPEARGLFHRAIVESGSATTTSLAMAENFVDDATPGDPFSSGEVLLKHLIADQRAGDRDEAKSVLAAMKSDAILDYLRSKTPKELLSIYESSGLGGMYRMPILIRDGAVLPSEPALEAFRRGNYNQVPTIMGTNRDENRLFLLFSSPFVAKFMGLPLWLKDVDRFQASADHAAKMWKVTGVDVPAVAMHEVQGDSVFAYRFDWDEEGKFMGLDLAEGLGAAHAMEIPFVFGWLTLGPVTKYVFDEDKQESNRRLSNSMMSYWAQFAYTGDPGRGRKGDQALWKSWSDASEHSDKFIIFDSEADGGVRMAEADALTSELVVAGVAKDARLADYQSDRCEIYKTFVAWGRDMSASEYNTIEDGRCAAEHPLE
jgi:para-nitrobenzyl esterase